MSGDWGRLITPHLLQLMRHFDFQMSDPRNPWDPHSYSIYVE